MSNLIYVKTTELMLGDVIPLSGLTVVSLEASKRVGYVKVGLGGYGKPRKNDWNKMETHGVRRPKA